MVLLLGDEEYLVSSGIGQVAAQLRAVAPATELTERAATEVEAGEIHEMLGPSLFGDRRMVVIRAAQDLVAAAVETLKPYLAAPADEITLVIHHSGGAKGKALLDAVRKAKPHEIACAKLTKYEQKVDFVRNEVRRAGGAIAPAAVSAVLDAVGSDLRELAAVAAQLVADSGGRVDVETVRRYHSGRAEVSGFTVADLVVEGRTAAALESLMWTLSIGTPQVVIADAIHKGISSVARAAAGVTSPAALEMPPWKVQKVRGWARAWSETGLQEALRIVATLNAEVKGEAASADYALERAVRALGAARAMR